MVSEFYIAHPLTNFDPAFEFEKCALMFSGSTSSAFSQEQYTKLCLEWDRGKFLLSAL